MTGFRSKGPNPNAPDCCNSDARLIQTIDQHRVLLPGAHGGGSGRDRSSGLDLIETHQM